MPEIRGLSAAIEDKPILQGIDLTVPQGEVHAIMGPNGSGKSTLAYVLSGREDYAVTAGSVTFDGRDLLAMAPEERAVAGVFVAFQYPVELPGVANAYFMRTALNALRRSRGEAELDAVPYDSFALNLGARIVRTQAHIQLRGPKGVAHLNRAQLLGGTQHADFTTVVKHDAPSCALRQTVKNVLARRSQGVFQGRIEVARVAQKTDGYQMSQTRLLSPDAETDTEPELEIFADDVKCSHGATVGELDADQLFYLRSRGIPDAQARSMLVRAFLAEALELVTDETVRGVLDRAVAGWWERQAA